MLKSEHFISKSIRKLCHIDKGLYIHSLQRLSDGYGDVVKCILAKEVAGKSMFFIDIVITRYQKTKYHISMTPCDFDKNGLKPTGQTQSYQLGDRKATEKVMQHRELKAACVFIWKQHERLFDKSLFAMNIVDIPDDGLYLLATTNFNCNPSENYLVVSLLQEEGSWKVKENGAHKTVGRYLRKFRQAFDEQQRMHNNLLVTEFCQQFTKHLQQHDATLLIHS